MTEIEFRKKFDPMAVDFINFYDEWQYDMDCTGFEIYRVIKNIHNLAGRMRRQIERKMRDDGTSE
jgi:hypothetical protein